MINQSSHGPYVITTIDFYSHANLPNSYPITMRIPCSHFLDWISPITPIMQSSETTLLIHSFPWQLFGEILDQSVLSLSRNRTLGEFRAVQLERNHVVFSISTWIIYWRLRWMQLVFLKINVYLCNVWGMVAIGELLESIKEEVDVIAHGCQKHLVWRL